MRYEGLSEEGKFYAIFWFLAFTTVIVLILTIAVHDYNMRDVYIADRKMEYQYKMACLQSRGNWQQSDKESASSPYSCTIK